MSFPKFPVAFIVLVSSFSAVSALSAVFSPVTPAQIPSGSGYKIQMPPVEDPRLFSGKRVAILVSHGVEEPELTFPYAYLKNRGARVDVLVPTWTPQGIVVSNFLSPHLWVTADGTFRSAAQNSYDLIILTGGAWNAQVVKTDSDALNLVRRHYSARRPIAAICAGTEVLITSGLSRGIHLTGPQYAATNLGNSGALFLNQPAVLDAGILTSRDPNDLPAFVEGIRKLLIGK